MLRYDEAIVVVKYGGHAMGDDEVARRFRARHGAARTIRREPRGRARRRSADRRHAGEARHQASQFADGLRVTDRATVEIVEMVLAGSINKQIVGFINAEGGRAIGLCGKDGNMVTATKMTAFRLRQSAATNMDRSRLRRRAGEGRHDGARSGARPRTDPGPRPGGPGQRRRNLQRQRRHFRRRHRRRPESQASAAS